MSGTAIAHTAINPSVVPASGVLFVESWLAARRPGCCPDARCSCACGCTRHSHYRRCEACAHDQHHVARPRLMTATERAARAFGEWPPPPVPGRLDHVLPRRGPREVDER